MIRYADPDRVRWVGVGAIDPDLVSPVMRAEMESLAPVAIGPAACRALAARSEVVVSWGLGNVADYLPRGPDRPLLIATSHGDGTSAWTRNVMAGSCPSADLIVAVSEAARGPIPEAYRPQARVIFNGVDRRRLVPRLSRPAQRAAWGVPAGAKVLGYLGRLSREKDPYAVSRAVACLPAEWVGVLVGDGLDARDVIEHAERTAPERTSSPGFTTDIGSALAAFDTILVPSLQDGFSLASVEAWMMGIPMVGTPTGGHQEHPDHLRLIPIGADGATIAAAVLADQADVEGTHARTRRARQVARTRYTAECFARQWSDLLWELARAGTSRDAPALPIAGRR